MSMLEGKEGNYVGTFRFDVYFAEPVPEEEKVAQGLSGDVTCSWVVVNGRRMARVITTVVLWTSVVQLIALGKLLGPSLFKGMPYCFSSSVASPSSEKFLVPAKVCAPT
ncbi:DUF246 domain-containing protein [Sesbania bispinosa]|nr:DUF246 domain-containing protein [Sesbania bispinosa]